MPVLTFKGRVAVENYHYAVPHHTLEYDKKRSLLGKSTEPALDGSLIVEGDNLIALKALLPTHAGKVKCIYIDPPYNTGNEGWIYNDNLNQPQFKEWIGQVVGKEAEDANRHEKWCCMMYPRLQLLRQFLTNDGVIFVSIDDIEIHNLRTLMDEVFGADNRLGTLIWRARNFSDSRTKTGVSTDHEYVLAYRRSAVGKLTGKRRSEAKYKNKDNDERGPWTSCSLLGKAPKELRPNLHYKLKNPETGITYSCKPETGWICSRTTMAQKIAEKRILWPKKPKGRPREKVFLNELKSGSLGFPSIIDGVYTSDGTEELRAIFGDQRFAFPKPSLLIRDLVSQVAGKDDIILDSFAGSGTTAHAVQMLNKEDGGNRRFVLVQMPFDANKPKPNEVNICGEVTAERVRRVALGYKDAGDAIPGLGGTFTYLRLGKPLLGENRDWADEPPPFAELARYVFYTETSAELDPKGIDSKSGKIGTHAGTSFYLLYTPSRTESRAFDKAFVNTLKKDPSKKKVVYCEKLWFYRDDLRLLRDEIGDVRPMLLPFQVK